jgi:hypothetical protein
MEGLRGGVRTGGGVMMIYCPVAGVMCASGHVTVPKPMSGAVMECECVFWSSVEKTCLLLSFVQMRWADLVLEQVNESGKER